MAGILTACREGFKPTPPMSITSIITTVLLSRNVIAAPMVGRPIVSAKVARAAKFQKNHGMGPWHGVCGTPGHDRSNDLVGPAGGGEAGGASAPSAGGSPPPDAAYTSVAAHFNSAMAARWAVSCSCGWVTVAETIVEAAALVEAHANRCVEPSEHLIAIRGAVDPQKPGPRPPSPGSAPI